MAAASLVSIAAHAQTLPGGVALGMTVPELQQAVPGLRPVAHPARLAGGLVGRWAGPAVDVRGVALVPTFFLADAQVRRVEYLAGEPASFDALLAWGRGAFGNELASQSPEGSYATWTQGDMQVYLQHTNGTVRLVIKRIVAKDDTEL